MGSRETQSYRKRFGASTAVDGVTFDVEKAETFGLLGPNGARKTTMINMIIGVLRPDRGSVVVGGVSDATSGAARMLIGVAPQTLALYEELTAAENLHFFGRLYGLSGTRLTERVDWAFEFAGLSDRRSHRVKTFSGGNEAAAELGRRTGPRPASDPAR